jgi:hypothetical protein
MPLGVRPEDWRSIEIKRRDKEVADGAKAKG